MTPKSIDIGPFGKTTPNSEARRTSRIARADRINALLGTHPTFKQSPPARFFTNHCTLCSSTSSLFGRNESTSPGAHGNQIIDFMRRL
mmetsp:Transcript_27011/g.48839  ORF Transcript_27011/g.48839 Transcript_27011/m.48839 type:complete len:88 (+) Transcript_27011:474-737(+)